MPLPKGSETKVVLRRYSEFEAFREYLILHFPSKIIPMLSGKLFTIPMLEDKRDMDREELKVRKAGL